MLATMTTIHKTFPVISIITPSFNQAQYIEETINSVLSQEGDFFIDYIINDGGSTDNSVQIIKKYDSLIQNGELPVRCHGIKYRWTSGRDRGQADAINKGFHIAEGEVVAWLNSDDYYLEGAFSTALNAFNNDSSLVMLYGDGYVVGMDQHKENYKVETLFDLWKLIHLYDFILQPSVFMRYTSLKKAGFLNDRLHYIMDWELWIRLSRFGKIKHIQKPLSMANVYFETKTRSAGISRWREIRWCSRRYGHKKWPPVMFTQLFHKPMNIALGNADRDVPGFLSKAAKYLKKIYYVFIRGNRSGVYRDGSVEDIACITLPLRKELSKIIFKIKPLCANTVRYYINNRYHGKFTLENTEEKNEIFLTDEMRSSDFLHMKFISDKSVDMEPITLTGTKRRCSFIIQAVFLENTDGKDVKDIGLPEFHDKRSSPNK